MEAYGAKVDWDSESKSVLIDKGDTNIVVPIGYNYIYVNGDKVENDTKAIIKNGRTYLPIRIVLESLGASVSWIQEDRTVVVENPQVLKEDIVHYVAREDSTGLDWRIQIPKGVDKDYMNLLNVQVAFGGKYGNDYYNYSPELRANEMASDSMARGLGYIELSIVIVEDDDHGNAAQFDGIFNESDPYYNNINEKVDQIIDEAYEWLKAEGYTVRDKVVLYGFSGRAVFAHKFAILYPERTYAIIAGSAGGYLTLLDESMRSMDFEWPFGLKDFVDNTGYTFNKEAFNEVQKFMYVGSADNEATYIGYYDDDKRFIKEHGSYNLEIGTYDPIRLYNTIIAYKEKGFENYYVNILDNGIHLTPYDYQKSLLEDLLTYQDDMEWSNYLNTEDEILAILENDDLEVLNKYETPNERDHRTYDFNFEVKWPMEQVVTFDDEQLHKVVCEHLGLPVSSELTYGDVYKIRTLYADNKGITSISGVEYLNNLRKLRLDDNSISDIAPIADLNFLVSLNLGRNPIENHQYLSGLSNLYVLQLYSTGLDSLDFLEKIDSLSLFNMNGNNVRDISILSKYMGMLELDVMENPLEVYYDKEDLKYITNHGF